MKSRELFQLAVRLLGLVLVYHGIMGLPNQVVMMFTAMQAQSVFGLFHGLVAAALPLAAGYWCIRGADPLVQAAYPESGPR